MKIFCKELNRDFESKQDMFTALKENKQDIINLKKSTIKNSECIQLNIKNNNLEKAETIKKLELGDWVKVAMNTTNYVDYDLDLLIDGSWDRSAKEQNGKTYHIINHDLAVGSIIAYPKDVKLSVQKIEWKLLGKSYEGKTQVLIFESKLTEKTNKDAFLAYRDDEEIQHSIRLQYILIDLAFKSKKPEDKKENELYEKYYPVIVNKEVVDELEYFWIVSEAKIYKEGSMVLFGSNDATPALNTKVNENLVICQECSFSFNYLLIPESGMGYVKCPECDSIVTQEMKSEPPSSTQNKNNEPPSSTQFDYEYMTERFKNLKI